MLQNPKLSADSYEPVGDKTLYCLLHFRKASRELIFICPSLKTPPMTVDNPSFFVLTFELSLQLRTSDTLFTFLRVLLFKYKREMKIQLRKSVDNEPNSLVSENGNAS